MYFKPNSVTKLHALEFNFANKRNPLPFISKVPGGWQGLLEFPDDWHRLSSYPLSSVAPHVTCETGLGGNFEAPGTPTQRPSLLVLGLPQLVWLLQWPTLEQCLAVSSKPPETLRKRGHRGAPFQNVT